MLGLVQRLARMVSRNLGPNRVVDSVRPYYLDALSLLSGGRGIAYSLNGIPCRIHPRYRDHFAPSYESEVAGYLRERINPNDVCFDIGANVGVYVIQLAHWSAPSGQIFAFEPEAECRRALHTHIDFNHLNDRVSVVNSAVGSSDGWSTLYGVPGDGMSRLGEPNILLEGRTTPMYVPVVSIDSFCSKGVIPDWIIMDIEGFEIAALQGGVNLLQRHAVGLVVEMHPGVWGSAGTSRKDAENLFRQLRREPISLTGQSDPLADQGIIALEPR